jgi:hypothetical protein
MWHAVSDFMDHDNHHSFPKTEITGRDLEIMRERHQILYQMLLDLADEIDSLREQVNMLSRLWNQKP